MDKVYVHLFLYNNNNDMNCFFFHFRFSYSSLVKFRFTPSTAKLWAPRCSSPSLTAVSPMAYSTQVPSFSFSGRSAAAPAGIDGADQLAALPGKRAVVALAWVRTAP